MWGRSSFQIGGLNEFRPLPTPTNSPRTNAIMQNGLQTASQKLGVANEEMDDSAAVIVYVTIPSFRRLLRWPRYLGSL